MSDQTGTAPKFQYGTSARYQMDDRTLLLRGGKYDGVIWTGVIAPGKRVFCGGDDDWSPAGVYLVTEQVEATTDGREANIAVPAFAAP